MKSKMKLTDLRHLETSKDEMKFIKGGDDPEQGPLLCQWACECVSSCIQDQGQVQSTEFSITKDNISGNSALSKSIDVSLFIIGMALGKVL